MQGGEMKETILPGWVVRELDTMDILRKLLKVEGSQAVYDKVEKLLNADWFSLCDCGCKQPLRYKKSIEICNRWINIKCIEKLIKNKEKFNEKP